MLALMEKLKVFADNLLPFVDAYTDFHGAHSLRACIGGMPKPRCVALHQGK